MKNILLITHDFPPRLGGVAQYLSGLYRRYPSDKLTILLDQNLKKSDKSAQDIWKVNEHPPTMLYTRFFSRWLWPRWFFLFIRVWRLQKQYQFDEIHCSHVLPIGTICYWIQKKLGTPYRIYFHGMDILLAKKKRFAKKRLINILRNAKTLVANSKFTAAQVQQIVPNRQDIMLWYPHVDAPQESHLAAQESLRSQYALEGKILMITVARLVARKGIDQTLIALAQVVKTHPNVAYAVIGEGPESARLQALMQQYQLQNNVRFIGAVSASEKAVWYQIADVYIMPTQQSGTDVEGFGMSYIEAASYGKSSIASDAGGAPEAVLQGKTGVVVPAGDIPSLAHAMIYLIGDQSTREQMGAQAKARYTQEFSWQNWEQEKTQIFEYDS